MENTNIKVIIKARPKIPGEENAKEKWKISRNTIETLNLKDLTYSKDQHPRFTFGKISVFCISICPLISRKI